MLSGDPNTGFVVVLPKFSKGLSGSGLKIQLESTTRFGSCAFDLAERLGLVSNRSNTILGDVETIPLYDLVHNNVTYCARISRHFLVRLISEHVQELWQGGDQTYISTDIGQFMLYAHEGRSLVHFDGSIRTSTATVIANQAIEDIQRVANGEYRDQHGTWDQIPIYLHAFTSTPLPLAVRYLSTKDIGEWRLMKVFAGVFGEIVQSVVQDVTEPASFAAAYAEDWSVPFAVNRAATGSASEKLACIMQAANLLIGKDVNNLQDRGRR
jgi:hypothetical protein